MKIKIKKRFLYLFLIIAVALCIIVYALPKMFDTMATTVLAEYGTLEQTDELTCYIIRNEKVYSATESGTTDYRIDEGVKIRKGQTICEISGGTEGVSGYEDLTDKLGSAMEETESCRAGFNGVLSYYVDGNEGTLNTANLSEITYSDCKELTNDFTDLKRKSVSAGEPIYKVYRNYKWYMLIWTDKATAANYIEGNTITVRFDDAQLRASVVSVKKQGGNYRICLSCNRYYDKLAQIRTADVTVVTSSASGLIIPTKSITEKNGQKGVEVKNQTEEYDFTPVNVLLQVDDQSVCTADKFYDEDGQEVNTISGYDEILRNP